MSIVNVRLDCFRVAVYNNIIAVKVKVKMTILVAPKHASNG